MDNRWRLSLLSVLLVGLFLWAGAWVGPQRTAALSLNPLDYYDYDYYIVLSHAEVEPGEPFSLTASASVTCTKDLPVGVREAMVSFSLHARNSSTDEEMTLLEGYDLTVTDVPDWEGDEYSTTESVDLEFPEDTTPGTYSLSAHLEQVSLDGWNVTGMVPSSSRTIGVGTIVCALPDDTPIPEPDPQPGVLLVSVLGHEFGLTIDDDGILGDSLHTPLIEGMLSIGIDEGTRCWDSSGEPLTHISAYRALSPPPYVGGAVLSAFAVRPSGAMFSPGIAIGMSYDPDELPAGCEESTLVIGYYDRTGGTWVVVPSTVDMNDKVVVARAQHFTTFGLLAPTATPGPARFVVRALEVSPAQVAPLSRVSVAVTIANTGDTGDSYPLVVSINGQPEHTEGVSLGPRESRTIRLTVVRSQPGVYEVKVNGLSERFAVVGASGGVPSGEVPGEDVTPSMPASNGTPSGVPDGGGTHPVYVALLALAGVAFLTLVVLVLAGVL